MVHFIFCCTKYAASLVSLNKMQESVSVWEFAIIIRVTDKPQYLSFSKRDNQEESANTEQEKNNLYSIKLENFSTQEFNIKRLRKHFSVGMHLILPENCTLCTLLFNRSTWRYEFSVINVRRKNHSNGLVTLQRHSLRFADSASDFSLWKYLHTLILLLRFSWVMTHNVSKFNYLFIYQCDKIQWNNILYISF